MLINDLFGFNSRLLSVTVIETRQNKNEPIVSFGSRRVIRFEIRGLLWLFPRVQNSPYFSGRVGLNVTRKGSGTSVKITTPQCEARANLVPRVSLPPPLREKRDPGNEVGLARGLSAFRLSIHASRKREIVLQSSYISERFPTFLGSTFLDQLWSVFLSNGDVEKHNSYKSTL